MQESVNLSKYTTLRSGGQTSYFAIARDENDMKEALEFAVREGLCVHVIGEGSNILVSDQDFSGLIIKNDMKGMEWGDENLLSVFVDVKAGESWDGFVKETTRKDLWGLENLSGIPGTVGASPIQNIGAYGVEVKDSVVLIKAINKKTLEEKDFVSSDCDFSYRNSFFKTKQGRNWIILSVKFQLKKEGNAHVEYKDIAKIIQDSGFKVHELNPKDIRKIVLDIRSKKFPDLNVVGTAGSFFKNPIVSKEKYDELKKEFPDLPAYITTIEVENTPIIRCKIPLAWILDNVLGKRGFKKGEVALFEKQPLVLVNFGKASSKEIDEFATEIEKEIFEKTGIKVEREVNMINF